MTDIMPHFTSICAADIDTTPRKRDWGPWKLRRSTYELVHRPDPCHIGSRYEYNVDLERCLSSADLLDWVAQIAQKTWANDENGNAVLAGLLRALDDVLHLQFSLCSGCMGGFGSTGTTLTRAQVRKRVREVPKSW